ncbi:phosphate ABC transporter substrate-binding protein [Lysinibacillus sp. NPDC096418]|uniref:phosphate ABC transporter substrate-binding protein n=1 Tax=Lysinibacillus sp. NPDC096418 TaxID=3364138 RepID=UPI0037F31814
MWKKLLYFLCFTVLLIVLVACSNEKDTADTQTGGSLVTISGSTSIGPLAEKLAMKYEEENDVKIEVNQIGSSAGITNAINGVSQIGMASRDLKQEEKDSNLQELIIAYDGIVVVAHPSNPIKNLTMEQVKRIFTGEVTNWKEIGGKDMEIVVVSREDGSGSRDAFQEIVGYKSGQLIKNAIVASGNGNIKTTVAMNKHAVGFISFEYVDESISTMDINGVQATAENVLAGQYELSRPFLFVHKEDVPESAKQFMEFILTIEGQKIVESAGAIPLTK